MPSQRKALRPMLAPIRSMQQAGYTDEHITELRAEAVTHLQGDGQKTLRLRTLHRVWPRHGRPVSPSVVHPGPRTLPPLRQALMAPSLRDH